MGDGAQEGAAQALLLRLQLGLLGVVLQAVDLEGEGHLVGERLQEQHLVRDHEPFPDAGLNLEDSYGAFRPDEGGVND